MPEKTQTESPRKLATAKRREQILEAAVTCFLENGYHQTGVRDIARRAGVSLGNLYNHFPGKHDVLVEIAALERAEMAPLLALLRRPDPAVKVLERFMTAYATYLAVPDNVILTIEITSEAIRKPDIGELFLANHNELIDALAEVIERGVGEGDFRADLDPHESSHLIIELIDGSAYRTVLTDVPMKKMLAGLRSFVFAAIRSG